MKLWTVAKKKNCGFNFCLQEIKNEAWTIYHDTYQNLLNLNQQKRYTFKEKKRLNITN
jgi:hypothetical protein